MNGLTHLKSIEEQDSYEENISLNQDIEELKQATETEPKIFDF